MAVSYGSITIVDITDIGEFSVYPQCNLPLSVIYDPNQSGANAYNPNWGTTGNALVLTPVVYYAGEHKALNTSGLTITWTKQIGTNSPSAVSPSSGETIGTGDQAGILTVSQNQFSDNINMVSYICTAQYLEPDSQQTLIAEGRITFTLVRHASKIKRCSITGENVFKYNTNQTLVGADEITLTATLENVTNGNWQYKNSSGTWTNFSTTYNTSINGTTIKVNAAETALFVNNVATIKKLTSDNNVYDIVNVTKLYDGAPGKSTIAIVLSNEDQMIPCDSQGNPTAHAFDQALSQVTVYEGGLIASGWTYNTPSASGVTGSWNSSTRTYTVNSWTGASEVASVTFTATKGTDTLSAVFTLTKIKTGADGTSPEYYELICSGVATNRDIGGIYSPADVTFTANKIVGITKTPYQGYIKIYQNNSSTASVATNMDASTKSYTYTFTGNTLEYLKVELYQTGGSGSILDKQTIVVTNDGQTGAVGPGAANVVLGNSAEIIPCNTNGTVKVDTTVTIPFTGYKGINKAVTTITQSNISGLIANQITCTSITNATATASGSVTLKFINGTNLNNNNNGQITMTFTTNGTSVPMTFSWAKSIQAADGTDAVVFQCYAPGGDIIENDSNNVTLSSLLTKGATTVSSGITYQWYQYSSTSTATDKYDVLSGQTNKNLTVTPAMVTGYGSFKCVAQYSGKSYSGYVAVRDKTDPIQVELFSSLGTQLLNGVGDGAVYARLFRNGVETDTIKSTTFKIASQAPSAASNTYYYKLDSSNKTCTLMKSNGSSWSAASGSDLPTYTYTWTFRDKEGNATTYGGASSVTGKAIYIGSSVINKKLILDCTVTEPSS